MHPKIEAIISKLATPPVRIAICARSNNDSPGTCQRHPRENTFAVLTSDIPCLILRESTPPSSIPEDEWSQERFLCGNQELFCFTRRVVAERWIETHAPELGGIHRIALLPMLALQSIDPKSLPPEAVAVLPDSSHSDLFLFSGGEFLAYFRIAQGSQDIKEDPGHFLSVINGIARHWWTETLPDQLPSAIVFLGTVPEEIGSLPPDISSIPVLQLNQNIQSLAIAYLEKSEADRRKTLPDSSASRNMQLWFRQEWWHNATDTVVRYLGGATVFALTILIMVSVGLAFLSVKYHDELTLFSEGEAYSKNISDLKRNIGNEQERLSRFLSLRSHRDQEISSIVAALPEDLWIDSWSIQGRNHDISGTSLTDSLIPMFQTRVALNQSRLQARLKTTERGKWNTTPVVRFEIGVSQ